MPCNATVMWTCEKLDLFLLKARAPQNNTVNGKKVEKFAGWSFNIPHFHEVTLGHSESKILLKFQSWIFFV
jgi:hypothetical protein